VILFCIDCSESMHELRDDPVYENVQTCHLLSALDAAMQIQKKKVVVGPNDSVGILLFNTVRCFYIVFCEDVQRRDVEFGPDAIQRGQRSCFRDQEKRFRLPANCTHQCTDDT